MMEYSLESADRTCLVLVKKDRENNRGEKKICLADVMDA